MKSACTVPGVLGILVLLLLSGTSCPSEGVPPEEALPDGGESATDPEGSSADDLLEDLTPPTDVFTGESDPSQLVSRTTPNDVEYTYPVNEMMVLMEQEATPADAEALAARLGGTIIGQIPDLGIYQIELDTTSAEELNVAIAAAELDGLVTSAGYNLSTAFRQSCPSEVDNEDLADHERCPFILTQYFQQITMFEFFRPHLRLHDVRVAVIDSGLNMSTGEFDEVNIVNLRELGEEPDDSHPNQHGTAVTGLIAADDDGIGVNGLASSMLREHLTVLVGGVERVVDELGQTHIAIAFGARVVNLSLGWSEDVEGFDFYRFAWQRIISENPDVLFICAAGDENLLLTGSNYAPGGINLPNVVTVGGFVQCDPLTRFPICNYGDVVDMAAPEESVSVVGLSGNVRTVTGTSFAAPQVTSLAAVLLALQPSLSPSRVAYYMEAHAMPSHTGAGRARLTFTSSISELLIAMDVPEPVMGWIDPAGLGNAGSSGLVLSRLCPAGIHFSVSEYGTYDLWEPDDEVGSGVIGTPVTPPSFNLASITVDGVALTFGSYEADFMLGTYAITTEGGPMTIQAGFGATDPGENGIGLGGSFTFDECRIEERDPFDGITPWVVRVSGVFEGILEVIHWDPPGIRTHDFEGYFSLPMIVTAGEGDPVIEYLEYHCDGGIPPDPPAEGGE